MDIQQLDYFIECAIFRSMRKVAQLRYCSASLVSRQIISLEQELNAKLFRRHTQGLEITKEGETFLIWALQAKERYDQLVENISPVPEDMSKVCRIVCCLFDDAYLQMTGLLDLLPAHSSGFSYRLSIAPLGKVVNQVINGRFQAGVIGKDAFQHFPDVFNTIHFGQNKYKVTIGKNHPLFTQQSVSTEQLIREYGHSDAYFLPGTLKKYHGKTFSRSAEILKLTKDYLYEYIYNTRTQGKWIQTASDIDHFDEEVTFGSKIAITGGTFATVNNENLNTIPFSDVELSEEIVLFWRKDTRNDALEHLLGNM